MAGALDAVGGGLGGGQDLGKAKASFVMDTSGLNQMEATAKRVGAAVATHLGQMTRAATTAEGRFLRLSNAIGKMQGQLGALALSGGILTGFGVAAASNLENAKIMLQGMVGSTEKAAKLMDELRKQAAATGRPFSQMLSVATQLLPTFQGSTKELEKWIPLASRLAVIQPAEGLAGAGFAIREWISSGGGDVQSLAERFNISRTQLKAALQETGGDFAAALDMVLARMGITATTAEQMGSTFSGALLAARDAAMQLLAEGFTPLLQAITPLIQKAADWLSKLRETAPAVGNVTASLLALSATAIPALLTFNQLVEAARKLKELGVFSGLGGLAGRIGPKGGLAIGALVAAPFVGMEIGRGIGRATGNEAMANADWSSVMTTLRQTFLILNKVILDGTQWLRTTLANLVMAIADAIANIQERLGLREAAASTRLGGRRVQQQAELTNLRERAVLRSQFQAEAAIPIAKQAEAVRAEEERISGERLEAITGYYTAVKKLDADSAQARLDEERSYGQQRAELIRQYSLSMAREEEDFARNRARQAEQLQKGIAEVREEAGKREAEWAEDFGERMAELREESTERLQEIEEDYQQQRVEAQKDHELRLLEAAASGDVRAFREEQRRFARDSEKAEANHKERVSDEEEQLSERSEQERENYEERLQEAREADEQRILDLRESLAEQQTLEDEDRRIRLERQAEDYQTQLTQMDTAHGQRLEQIDRHAADERERLDTAFAAQMTQLGEHNAAWLIRQKELQDSALKLFDTGFWAEINKRLGSTATITGPGEGGGTTIGGRRTPTTYQPFAEGGPVLSTGLALLHRGEFVMPAPSAQRGWAGASGGRSLNVQAGAITVNESQRPGQTAMEIREMLISLLEEAA